MKLKTLPVIAALLLPSLPPLPAGAQARLTELSAYGEGGLSTLYYSLPDIARRSNALGGGGGLGYAFFFTDQVSLHTGAGLTLYRAQAKLSDGFGAITATLDDYYEPAELHSTFSRHAERQTALMLRLPLQGQWQSKVKSRSRGHRFYVRGGLRLEIPLMVRSHISAAQVSNELYYPAYGVTLTEPAYKGLGSFSGASYTGKLELGLAVVAAAEAGVKWKLSQRLSLYTGIYAGVGVNNVAKAGGAGDFLAQDELSPADFSLSSVLASRYTPEQRFTDRVLPVSAGVKIELAFGIPPVLRLGRGKANELSGLLKKEGARDQLPNSLRVFDERILKREQELRVSDLQIQRTERQQRQQQARANARERQRLEAKAREDLLRQQEDELRQKVVTVRSRYAGTEGPCGDLIEQISKPIVSFSVAQTTFSPDQMADLKVKLALMRLNPSMKIACTGYSCDIGTPAAKERVSRQRAEAMKKYLIRQGISENRIGVIAESDKSPIAPNTNEANRRKNRRIEITITDLTEPCILPNY